MNERAPRQEGDDSVHDESAAWNVAHAEKPYRDALVDYRDSLSEEGEKSLEWIASQEGEKALAKYQEGAKEDPRVKILRERALATLEIPEDVFLVLENQPDRTIVSKLKFGLRELGKITIEGILASGSDITNKLDRLKWVGPELTEGIRRFVKDTTTARMTGNNGNIARGKLIGAVMAGSYTRIENTMDDAVAEEKITHRQFVRNYFSFFETARISYPKIGEGLDGVMEKYGLLWDNQHKKYIEL